MIDYIHVELDETSNTTKDSDSSDNTAVAGTKSKDRIALEAVDKTKVKDGEKNVEAVHVGIVDKSKPKNSAKSEANSVPPIGDTSLREDLEENVVKDIDKTVDKDSKDIKEISIAEEKME